MYKSYFDGKRQFLHSFQDKLLFFNFLLRGATSDIKYLGPHYVKSI